MFAMVILVPLVTIAKIFCSATLFGLGNIVSLETMVAVVTVVTLVKRVIVRSLHDVHEINAYGLVMSVRPSIRRCVRMIKLEKQSTELDVVWYGGSAIGDCPKIVLLNFL
jgi:hypothetical protein